jgi:hypothetical protein
LGITLRKDKLKKKTMENAFVNEITIGKKKWKGR